MMLIVTEPAADLQLLTEEELRVAAGLEPDDDSQDEALAIQGLRAAAALAAACGVATAGYDASLYSTATPLRGAAPRTLHAETLVETMRVRPRYQYGSLYLARWPVLEIISVTEDTTELTTDDWDLDIPMGSLTRISGNETLYWPCGRVIVEYAAGYDTIPDDLKMYASQLVGIYHLSASSSVDPNTKHVEIPGVITLDRWVDQTKTDTIVPEDIKSALVRDGYRRPVLA
jgi:hypothetical protein